MKFVAMKSLSDCVDWIVLREMGQRTKMLSLVISYLNRPLEHTAQYSISKRPSLSASPIKRRLRESSQTGPQTSR